MAGSGIFISDWFVFRTHRCGALHILPKCVRIGSIVAWTWKIALTFRKVVRSFGLANSDGCSFALYHADDVSVAVGARPRCVVSFLLSVHANSQTFHAPIVKTAPHRVVGRSKVHFALFLLPDVGSLRLTEVDVG